MWDKLKVVGAEDTLIHVGDVGFYKDRGKTDALFRALPGKTKILIKGNHDKKRPILKSPWDAIHETYGFEHAGLKFFLQHRPFTKEYSHTTPDWKRFLLQASTEILRRVMTFPLGTHIAIHGHIHELGQQYQWHDGTLVVNACVEHWNYRPFSIEEVVDAYYQRRDYESGK